ncbi:hypothetical protein GUU_02683 [Malacoplasma iowae 695]|nr:hypothetical protein GUU_02683 [Malacoplasma iowae 695]
MKKIIKYETFKLLILIKVEDHIKKQKINQLKNILLICTNQ